jgi:hypothetical protein
VIKPFASLQAQHTVLTHDNRLPRSICTQQAAKPHVRIQKVWKGEFDMWQSYKRGSRPNHGPDEATRKGPQQPQQARHCAATRWSVISKSADLNAQKGLYDSSAAMHACLHQKALNCKAAAASECDMPANSLGYLPPCSCTARGTTCCTKDGLENHTNNAAAATCRPIGLANAHNASAALLATSQHSWQLSTASLWLRS